MNKSLTEKQLRNVVYNTIKESISDMSPEELRNAGKKSIEKGREGYGKYGSYSEIPAGTPEYDEYMKGDKMIGMANKCNEIKMTESQLKESIFNGIKNAVGDYMRGFSIDEKEPTNYTEILARCGYKVKGEKPINGGKQVYCQQMSGPAAIGFTGDSEKEVVEALNRFYKRNVAQYLGRLKNKQWICVFKIIGI